MVHRSYVELKCSCTNSETRRQFVLLVARKQSVLRRVLTAGSSGHGNESSGFMKTS